MRLGSGLSRRPVPGSGKRPERNAEFSMECSAVEHKEPNVAQLRSMDLIPVIDILRRAESSSHCNFSGYQECQAPVPHRLLHSPAEYPVLEQFISIILFQGINS